MRHSQGQTYQTGRRIQTFLDANDSLFSVINKSATRLELDSAVNALDSDAGVQATGRAVARGEQSNQRALRLALRRDHMRPIASIAKLRLRAIPTFAAFTMPTSALTGKSLVAHATGMAGAAKPYEQVFVDAGLSADFLAKLADATTAVETSIVTRSTARGQQSKATGSLKQRESQARKVFAALNDLVVPILSADVANSGLLAEWKSVRKVALKPGPVAGSEPTATQVESPPASTQAPVAATAPAAAA
jgi:hypothetical protein